MTTINSTLGSSAPENASKVQESTAQIRKPKVNIPDREHANPLMPRGVDDVLPEVAEPVGRPETPSYGETKEVADKLQSRINELAPDPHLVAIHNDDSTNEYVIEIKDPDGNIVKQFPPEKVLNLRKRMDDLSGMVIDEMI
jgi:uncharacterized FlaG/YvyC family protein